MREIIFPYVIDKAPLTDLVLIKVLVWKRQARSRKETLNFVIVESDSPYNLLSGRTTMQKMGIVVSTIYASIKFQKPNGVGMVYPSYSAGRVEDTYKKAKESTKNLQRRLQELLRANMDVFVWTYADMTGVPRKPMIDGNRFGTEHKLNDYNHIEPIKQKRRGLAPERNVAACKEVDELTIVRILREVKYQTWVANPIM
ncbi:hypothetical protein Tco_0760397, partial [Tanacetum coccineum]